MRWALIDRNLNSLGTEMKNQNRGSLRRVARFPVNLTTPYRTAGWCNCTVRRMRFCTIQKALVRTQSITERTAKHVRPRAQITSNPEPSCRLQTRIKGVENDQPLVHPFRVFTMPQSKAIDHCRDACRFRSAKLSVF